MRKAEEILGLAILNAYRGTPTAIFTLAILRGLEPFSTILNLVISQTAPQVFHHLLDYLSALGYIHLDLAELQTAIFVANGDVLTAFGKLLQSCDDVFTSLTSFFHNIYLFRISFLYLNYIILLGVCQPPLLTFFTG
jgi:hypothetical protein